MQIWTEILSHGLMGKAVFLLATAIVALVVQRVAVKSATKVLEASSVPSASIFVNIVRVVIWAFALIVVLEPVFGIQPTAFVTALGVTSIALSLGLQDTVSNVIGGLFLTMAKIVDVGDHITTGSTTGEVTDINWRSTKLTDELGNVIIIPNSVLNKQQLTKVASGQVRKASLSLLVRSSADLNAVSDEIEREVTRALGVRLDTRERVSVQFEGSDYDAIRASVYMRYVPGETSGAVTDVAMRALSGKPWLAGQASEAGRASGAGEAGQAGRT